MFFPVMGFILKGIESYMVLRMHWRSDRRRFHPQRNWKHVEDNELYKSHTCFILKGIERKPNSLPTAYMYGINNVSSSKELKV